MLRLILEATTLPKEAFVEDAATDEVVADNDDDDDSKDDVVSNNVVVAVVGCVEILEDWWPRFVEVVALIMLLLLELLLLLLLLPLLRGIMVAELLLEFKLLQFMLTLDAVADGPHPSELSWGECFIVLLLLMVFFSNLFKLAPGTVGASTDWICWCCCGCSKLAAFVFVATAVLFPEQQVSSAAAEQAVVEQDDEVVPVGFSIL